MVTFRASRQFRPPNIRFISRAEENADRRGGNLPGGQQPNVVHEIGDLILRLNQQEGLTVLLVEQKLPFARRVVEQNGTLSPLQSAGMRPPKASVDPPFKILVSLSPKNDSSKNCLFGPYFCASVLKP
jgi:hypothetical protein